MGDMTVDDGGHLEALLECQVRTRPDAVACVTGGRTPRAVTFAELAAVIDRTAASLRTAGVRAGTRASVMVQPGVEMVAIVHALLRMGAVPVLVDRALPQPALRACLAEAAPEVFIGVPLAQAARVALGWARTCVRTTITVGPRRLWLGRTVRGRRAGVPPEWADGPQPTLDDVALIAYTSGTTGVPKGVPMRHGHLLAQVSMLERTRPLAPGTRVLSTFPPFAVAATLLGACAVIPAADARRPSVLVADVRRFGVTVLFAPPAVLDRVARYCLPRGHVLDPVRTVFTAGAPLAHTVVERARACLPADAVLYSAYGSTECMLVSAIEGRDLAVTGAVTAGGAGTCLGEPLPGQLVRIIAVTDGPIRKWSDDLLVPPGTIGEITVTGPTVADPYLERPGATARARIADGDRTVHRTGDLGRLDDLGRLWFAGRAAERVRTPGGDLCTGHVEPIFDTLRGVHRTALVGVGPPPGQRPVLVVEPEPGTSRKQRARIRSDALALAARRPGTAAIRHVLFHYRFPVDVRHDTKIRRDELAVWAAHRLHRGAR
ncbi:fatty acid CoA ligase family protein [Actinomadura algeriensis]|uniref:Acyl-CoA synthetase (AMP-forming)/AMP-acid ligase II n=1 Tax=Actinomadura algeriensis TaxID=1679523 RepID=A0ABR9K316_9ACTN|nr:fatty acid CoA ligase family protein [Actinomadura algeriensis]MBE1537245.1 acyl-CoA synthetase (AMP-forming)/AMP-acid ligase II [Actinomadura algeriensis]